MSNKVNNFKKTHAINSWLNLILSAFIIIVVFVIIVINILAKPNELVEEVGAKTFRMFTVLSNMLVGIACAMSIPFAVDGIRQKNYHLPRWIVNLIYTSVTCITLTFLISLCILSPNVGFMWVMLSNTNLFLHTIIPVTAIILFLFINTYHTIKFKTTFIAIIPIVSYALIYLVFAIIIGEDDGGWRDHYHFNELMPWYFVFIIIMAIAYGIANLLRFIHNRMHLRDKIITEAYYQNSEEYDLPTIEEVIIKLAKDNKQYDTGGEVIVPRRIIKFLDKKYNSNHSLTYLCNIYLEEYLKD